MTRDEGRERLRAIADRTLSVIEKGSYVLNNVKYELAVGIVLSKRNTQYYAPNSLLSGWSTMIPASPLSLPTEVLVLEVSTLEGAHLLARIRSPPPRVGILNFASATKPGGGFKNGAQAQEESIARSSTLYPTLTTTLSQTFYMIHSHDSKGGYYSHAMIYSPGITVFRSDAGGWIEPMQVDVLTSAAVNAGVVRRIQRRADGSAVEGKIGRVMRERMARILFLFEKQGVRNVVLGSFGTGVFRNDVGLVANIWADLLLEEGARFKASFERVVFAILGKSTFEEFERVFARRSKRDHKSTDG